MIIFRIKNLSNGVEFDKVFDTPYLARLFRNKCFYSKKIKIVMEQYSSEEVRRAVCN